MKRTLAAVAVASMIPQAAQSADTYEGAVTELANQIMETSTIEGAFTVGITNFYHVDNTCSHLSNEMVTRMKSKLFRASDGKARVVSRHLLPKILNEIAFNTAADSPVDPGTAPNTGKISGVQTLLFGNILERQDRISVSMELIETETAIMKAIAEADFPRTNSVNELIATRSAEACGVSLIGNAVAGAATTPGAAVQSPGPSTKVPPRQAVANFDANGFSAKLVRAVYSKSKKTATFVIRFENTSDKPIRLAYTPRTLSVTDDLGTMMPWKDAWSGLKTCNTYKYNCTFAYNDRATELDVGKQAQLAFNVSSTSEEPPANVSVGMEIIFSPNPDDKSDYKLIALGMYDVPLEVR
ncbi:MAG: hypothetical protein AAFN27_00185 [Pseudomonadota bacterium]